MRAAEDGSRGLLLLSMALVGIGFNVKMLAAFVVLPTFVLVYFLGAPVGWRRRLVDLTMATLVLAAVSLSWVLAYDLTPPDKRPFAGSSTTNSMLELAMDHNGLQRFVPRWRPFRPARIDPGTGQAATAGAQPGARGRRPDPGRAVGGRGSGTASPSGPCGSPTAIWPVKSGGCSRWRSWDRGLPRVRRDGVSPSPQRMGH
jgi:hypothetical protein